jgi:hypothetical protein
MSIPEHPPTGQSLPPAGRPSLLAAYCERFTGDDPEAVRQDLRRQRERDLLRGSCQYGRLERGHGCRPAQRRVTADEVIAAVRCQPQLYAAALAPALLDLLAEDITSIALAVAQEVTHG